MSAFLLLLLGVILLLNVPADNRTRYISVHYLSPVVEYTVTTR